MEREDGGSKRLPNGILFLISSLYNVYRTLWARSRNASHNSSSDLVLLFVILRKINK